MRPLIFILLFFLTQASFGQHKADSDLNRFLVENKLDTFIYVKTGCTVCIPSYEDSPKSNDVANIKLLYRQKGYDYLIGFSDTTTPIRHEKKTTSIFQYVNENIKSLKKKTEYYNEAKKAKFQAPCLKVFPYEIVSVKIGKFVYGHTSVDRKTDDCGTYVTHTEWFRHELQILTEFDKL